MKTFLIIALLFVGIIKNCESIRWRLTFFDSTVGYSELNIIKIVAFSVFKVSFPFQLGPISPWIPVEDDRTLEFRVVLRLRTLSFVHFDVKIDWFTNTDCKIVEFSIEIFIFKKVEIELERSNPFVESPFVHF